MRSVQLHNFQNKDIFISPDQYGRVGLEEFGISSKGAFSHDGMLRLVFDFGQLNFSVFSDEVYIELFHDNTEDEVHWHCEFNDDTVLDDIEEEGYSTKLIFNRDQFIKTAHHHNNILTVFGDFGAPVSVDVKKSAVHFLAG